MGKIGAEWLGNMKFRVHTPSGHEVVMDASREFGGEDGGPRPMELVLVALMGCTGMDVVSILKKMRVEDYQFEVETGYERASDHPKVYTRIHLRYIFKGKDLPRDKIEKAVSLSQERYCSVAAMLKRVAPLTYEVILEETN